MYSPNFNQPQSRQPQSHRWIGLFTSTLGATIALSALIAAPMVFMPNAIAQPTAAQPTDTQPTDARLARPAQSVLTAIRQDLAKRGFQQINLVSASSQQWPDGCLGLPNGKAACTMAIVPGWYVEVSDGLQTWFYRTNTTGSILRLENADRAVLPQKVAQTLIQKIARDTHTTPSKLKIAAIQPANFDGCLGIYRPQQICTKILIRGFQAIVTTPTQSLVYHLNQNATKIAQNNTASGAKTPVRLSFELFGGNAIPPLESPVIFRSSVSGGLIGSTTTITLTNDGKITEFTTAPNIRSRPVVRKTLTPQQLTAFQQILQNRRFRNFNGLSYLTSAALADYPTTTYQSQDSVMQFIDLEKANFPLSLRQVINTWDRLIQP
jgi:hypothetical protein